MPYTFLGEDDNKFTLSNGDGEFSIAKYGLDDGFMEKLRSLPRAYAEGGMVEPMDVGMDQPMPEALPPSPLEQPLPMESVPYAPEILETRGVSPESMKAGSAMLEKQRSAMPAPPVTEPPPAMGIPSWLSKTESLASQTAPGASFMTSPYQDTTKSFNDAFNSMKAANAGMAAANEKAAIDSMKAQEESITQLQNLNADYQSNLTRLNEESNRLQQDVMASKIDPNKIWNNMNTGNRVMAGISIMLGGLSQGLTGAKSNPAMDVINNAIDRDIDAQKAELGKKQNLLSFNMAKYGRLDAATAATRMQLLSVTQSQINKAAAQAQSVTAVNQAKMANAQIDMQKAQLMQGLAGQQTVNAILNAPQGIPADMVMKLPPDVRKTLVRTPQGTYYQALNEQAAERVSKAMEAIGNTEGLLQSAKAFMDEGRVWPGQDRKGTAQFLDSQLVLQLKNLNTLGVLSAQDKEIIDDLKPNLFAKTFTDQEKAKLNALMADTRQKINMFYKNNVPNYNPTKPVLNQTPIMRP